jgi:alpha-L-fucosidase 2
MKSKRQLTAVFVFTFASFAIPAFCQNTTLPSVQSALDPVERAKLHPIIMNSPAPDFSEGALLGNGGLGAVVTTRPDAVVIHFSHNDVWDIRIAENNKNRIGTFQEIFDKVKSLPDTLSNLENDPWYRAYAAAMRENDGKPYPRPFPCGSVILWFDRREAELLGHYVHINSGFCEVDFLIDNRVVHLQIFTDMTADRLWARMVDDDGLPAPVPFKYLTVQPDPETPPELPLFDTVHRDELGMIGYKQILPARELASRNEYRSDPADRAFSLKAWVNGGFLSWDEVKKDADLPWAGRDIPGQDAATRTLTGLIDPMNDFILCVQLDNGPATKIDLGVTTMAGTSDRGFRGAAGETIAAWEEYWKKSGIALGDDVLERTWYQNMYFLRCALRPGVTCPGIFANWSYRTIGNAQHGGYFMDYRTQQPFWAVFSSNHPELNLPYTDMVERYLLPVARTRARDYYGLRGASFPTIAYPVNMTTMPDPLPPRSWDISITPWTVQSYWWHFMYTMDLNFLRNRAFPVMREAVEFLVDYMKRPEAQGSTGKDNKYHIFPSIPPGLDEISPGLAKNADTLPDLTMTRFVFFAYLEACSILGNAGTEQNLVSDVRELLSKFPEYPTAETQWGDVFVSVKGEDPDTVYNIPASLMTVFPGEELGLHSSTENYRRAARTYLNQQNEGGSDLVFLNLIGARLGMLDIDKFIRQIEYCLLPNGTCTNRALQVHGRYSNDDSFDIMADKGVIFENFGLPAVVNECLLQSYSGTIRVFPNWPGDLDAEFKTLRAAGAFLVSARMTGGEIEWVEITSEAGALLRLAMPWESGATVSSSTGRSTVEWPVIELTTKPGEVIRFQQRQPGS